jgi:hypothetical protein
MGGVVLAVIIIEVLVFLYSGNLNTIPSVAIENLPTITVVPFTKLVQGMQSSISTRINYLITSTDELEKLWKMISASEKIPTVDFTRYSVAAVFAGEKPTNDYTIAVSRVEDTNVRTVIVTLAQPTASCKPKHSITAPYELIVLPKTSLALTHEDRIATTSCSQ